MRLLTVELTRLRWRRAVVILVAASLAWKGDLLGGLIEGFRLKPMPADHVNSTERKS
jgi:hypothetical protein